MREERSRSPAEPGWGWLGAISLLLALVGGFVLVGGLLESAFGGMGGGCPNPGPAFAVGAVCGLASVLAGVVGWLKTKGRMVSAWMVFAGSIGGLVLVVGARGAYENFTSACGSV